MENQLIISKLIICPWQREPVGYNQQAYENWLILLIGKDMMKYYYVFSKVGKFRELKLANAVKIVVLLKASYTIIEIVSLCTALENLKGVSDII